MGTALLGEDVDVAESKDIVWGGESGLDAHRQESVLERVVRNLRREGYDAAYVEEYEDDFDIRQYIDKKVLKRLDEMRLGRRGGSGNGEAAISKVK